MNPIVRLLPALALLACGLPASAQDEMPAMSDEPALSSPPIAAPGQKPQVPPAGEPGVVQATSGTSIIGEQESPIGLYIMPWRQSAASTGLDRPARLLDEALQPLDPEVFKRQVAYYDALSKHLEKQGLITPDSKP